MNLSIPKGLRTWTFGLLTLGFILGGFTLAICYPTAGLALFATYAGVCVAVLGIVAGRNLGQDAVGGDGIGGAIRNVFTRSKPGEPPPPDPKPGGAP